MKFVFDFENRALGLECQNCTHNVKHLGILLVQGGGCAGNGEGQSRWTLVVFS